MIALIGLTSMTDNVKFGQNMNNILPTLSLFAVAALRILPGHKNYSFYSSNSIHNHH